MNLMNRKGQFAYGLLAVMALVLVVMALFSFASFGGQLGDSDLRKGAFQEEIEMKEAYVVYSSEALAYDAINCFSCSSNVPKERFLEVFGRFETIKSFVTVGNFFGKIRSGDFTFEEKNGEFTLKIDDLFVKSVGGENEVVRNFYLVMEFNSRGELIDKSVEYLFSNIDFSKQIDVVGKSDIVDGEQTNDGFAEESLLFGEFLSLGVGESHTFEFEGEEHSIILESYDENKVGLIVESKPIKAFIRLGEFLYFDLNVDGRMDIAIGFDGIDPVTGEILISKTLVPNYKKVGDDYMVFTDTESVIVKVDTKMVDGVVVEVYVEEAMEEIESRIKEESDVSGEENDKKHYTIYPCLISMTGFVRIGEDVSNCYDSMKERVIDYCFDSFTRNNENKFITREDVVCEDIEYPSRRIKIEEDTYSTDLTHKCRMIEGEKWKCNVLAETDEPNICNFDLPLLRDPRDIVLLSEICSVYERPIACQGGRLNSIGRKRTSNVQICREPLSNIVGIGLHNLVGAKHVYLSGRLEDGREYTIDDAMGDDERPMFNKITGVAISELRTPEDTMRRIDSFERRNRASCSDVLIPEGYDEYVFARDVYNAAELVRSNYCVGYSLFKYNCGGLSDFFVECIGGSPSRGANFGIGDEWNNRPFWKKTFGKICEWDHDNGRPKTEKEVIYGQEMCAQIRKTLGLIEED